MGAPAEPAIACTLAPSFQARLIARNALFSAGSITSTGPDPDTRPAVGTMDAVAGSLLNPAPGTLSNGAASAVNADAYGVGFILGSGAGPKGFRRRRRSSGNGLPSAITRRSEERRVGK